MSQHDMILDNAIGLPTREDINAALAALVSVNAGPTAPLVTYAGQLWLDTSVAPNGLLKQRDLANANWIPPVVPPSLAAGIVRADIAQSFIATEQTLARNNIGISGVFKRTIILANTTHVLDVATRFVLVECIGGGGGASGVTGPTTAAPQAGNQTSGSAPGGGAGGRCTKFFAKGAIASGAVLIGIGGPGGIGSANGQAGGATSWTDGVNTLTANGGLATAGTGPVITLASFSGGVGGTATGGDINLQGQGGEPCISLANSLSGNLRMAVAGNGGNTVKGAGGLAGVVSTSGTLQVAANGQAARAYGGGGGGGVAVNVPMSAAGTVAANGGAGGQGICTVWEFK
jgi:hypothetical protein